MKYAFLVPVLCFLSMGPSRELPVRTYSETFSVNDDPGPNAAGNRYALLIGVSSYRNIRPLRGCVNDINLVRDFLLKRDFESGNIIMLPNEKATKDSIMAAFDRIIQTANDSSVVLIHFSGHGSQVADDQPGEETDGWDESLLPYNYVNSKSEARRTSITDDEMDSLLMSVTAKTEQVTVILDACHSGGGTRNLTEELNLNYASTRYIPPVDSATLRSTKERAFNELTEEASGYEGKDARYVLITGCRSDELSRETPISNRVYGILTHTLISELMSNEGAQVWPDVMDDVRYEVRLQNYYQTPQLAGDKANSYVFGDKLAINRQFALVSPGARGVIEVERGEIMGISKGSVFQVFPPGTNDFENTAAVAQIEIVSTTPSSAKAKVLKGAVRDLNSRARESGHGYPNSTLKLSFQGNWQASPFNDIKATILAIDSVRVNDRAPQLIVRAERNAIIFSLPYDTTGLVRIPAGEPGARRKVADQTSMWRKWFHVMQISNRSASIKLGVKLEVAAGGRAFDQVPVPDYIFFEDEPVELAITNNSTVPLFINILDLQDNGVVAPYTLGQFRRRVSNEAIAPRQQVVVNVPLTVPEEKECAFDIMKIFATTEDMDFEFLRQSADSQPRNDLGKVVAREFSPDRRTVGVKEWATVEKVILLKRKARQ